MTLDQLVTLTVNSGVYFEGIGGLESPENESVGHSQTRPESGRISGMKVTQASPQIYRQTYCQKKLLKSLPKPLIFNIFGKKMDAGLILTSLPET